jgi:hypothetical protein
MRPTRRNDECRDVSTDIQTTTPVQPRSCTFKLETEMQLLNSHCKRFPTAILAYHLLAHVKDDNLTCDQATAGLGCPTRLSGQRP